MRDNKFKKVISSPWLVLSILLLGDLLMMAGAFPRGLSFILFLISAFYIFKAKMPSVYFLIIAYIPFTPALPISGFDTFAMWRPLIALLALRVLWQNKVALKTKISFTELRQKLFLYEWLGILLLILAALSLFTAESKVLGLRKLVFLSNAVLLYVILRFALKDESALKQTKLGLLTGFIGILIVGVSQYITVIFTSLYNFWQGWAHNIVPIFYGYQLGDVLSNSNTWFSYYQDSAPTLRMFSVLPDSHSLGLIMLIAFCFTLVKIIPLFAPYRWRAPKYWRQIALLALFGMATFLSGSRGIWLSAIPTFFAAAILWVRWKKQKSPNANLAKTALAVFLLLIILFPLSSVISSNAHGRGARGSSEILAFERAKSIFDLTETSNNSRLGIWLNSSKSVIKHPVLGIGFGNSASALGESVLLSRQGASAHNLYLDYAVETGILGGIAIFLFFAAIVYRLLFPLSREISGKSFSMALCVVWIMFYNLFDVVFLNDRALLAFLVFLSCATAVTKDPETFKATTTNH